MLSKKKGKYTYGVMHSDEVGIYQGGIPFRISKASLEEVRKCGMGYDEDGVFDPELYILHKEHQYDYTWEAK